ncbi:hypothetical protein BDB01DRAFT_853256 [Pilobolus umbonatus]|nr:hypothetical protein BDB01DRAFT_853256 [Pilobolus umbonatus]
MSITDINNMPSIRLASGIEVQQRWPSPHQQKVDNQPKLFQMSPMTGNEGTIVTVVIQSLHHHTIPIKLAFNTLVVDTKQMQGQGITSLVASVPPFQLTHSTTANVPVYLCLLDKGSFTSTWLIAEFVYDFTQESSDPMLMEYSPKQKDLAEESLFPPRDNLYSNPNTNGFYNFYPPVISDSMYNGITGQQDSSYPMPIKSEFNADNRYSDLNRGNTNSIGYTPNNLFNSNSSGLNSLLEGLASEDTSLSLSQSQVPFNSSSVTSSPILINKPYQPQRPEPSYKPTGYGKSSIHLPSTSVANYQPYPGLVSRANLKLMDDLDTMSKNWSNEEWNNHRRLVQFWREQNGNEIQCRFAPISQTERMSTNNGQIVVSCIYWAERNDCFITSVDCIHLLESILAIRFSVEEKNRVRRNLEGFRPLTVSKCKSDSAEFFKLIMSFPNPKPRNIEKDVKVFPWKTLPYALKKIVTKYTAASYHINNSHNNYHRRSQTKQLIPSPRNSYHDGEMKSFYSQSDQGVHHPLQSVPQPPAQSRPQSSQTSQIAPQPLHFQNVNYSYNLYQEKPNPFSASPYQSQSSSLRDSTSPRQYNYDDILHSAESPQSLVMSQSSHPSPNSSLTFDNQPDFMTQFE